MLFYRITSLQRAAFKLFPDLRRFALSNVASVDTHKALLSHFGGLRSAHNASSPLFYILLLLSNIALLLEVHKTHRAAVLSLTH